MSIIRDIRERLGLGRAYRNVRVIEGQEAGAITARWRAAAMHELAEVREARLDARINQAAERYPEPGNPDDWYSVSLNADPELTQARKDAAFFREQMLCDGNFAEDKVRCMWDMR
jgi:hypothetical protein